MKNDLFSKMSKVGDIAKKVTKKVAEDPKIREMGSQVTQKLSVAGKQIQDQMPSQAEISKISKSISKTIGDEISKNSVKTRDFTAKKLREFSTNLENQKLQNPSKPENNRLLEIPKNNDSQSNQPKTIPNQTSSNQPKPTNHKDVPVSQSKSTFGTPKNTLAAENFNSGNVPPSQNEQSSIFRPSPKSDVDQNENQSPSEGMGLLDRIKSVSEPTPTPTQTSVSSYLASGSRFIPQRFKNYLSVPTALTEKKKSYDTFKSRLALSRNVWITGALAGIIAAMVGTVYTYEAILIQRRNDSYQTVHYQPLRIYNCYVLICKINVLKCNCYELICNSYVLICNCYVLICNCYVLICIPHDSCIWCNDEAIKREKELLNIEIEIKKIELERLRDVYKEELLTKERAKYAQHSERLPSHPDNRKSWLSYITGN